MIDVQFDSHSFQAPIACPKTRVRVQRCGSEEMHIDVPQTAAVQEMVFQKKVRFVIRRALHSRQRSQQGQYLLTCFEMATGKFTDNKWMGHNGVGV